MDKLNRENPSEGDSGSISTRLISWLGVTIGNRKLSSSCSDIARPTRFTVPGAGKSSKDEFVEEPP
jgi:hypothetical protein